MQAYPEAFSTLALLSADAVAYKQEGVVNGNAFESVLLLSRVDHFRARHSSQTRSGGGGRSKMATLLANLKVLLPPFGRSVLITVIIITIKCVAARGLKLLRQT